MGLLEEIFANEVFPAVGCTEPISCAYAAATAVELLGAPPTGLELLVDPGTYKNGAAVTVPNSGGQKGNVVAAALGAAIGRSDLRLEILTAATPEALSRARGLLERGAVSYRCTPEERGFRVEVRAERDGCRVRCVVSEGHANVTCLEKDGRSALAGDHRARTETRTYRDVLRGMRLEEVLRAALELDERARAHIRRGVAMNLAIADKGPAMRRTGWQLERMMADGLIADDLFYRVKRAVACAVDARMGGLPEPVMTSGGSGNQGCLATLVPHLVGTARGVEPARVEESIAVCHAVNSYVKCHVGELSVICGCAIAAGIGTAIGLVYQQAGVDLERMTLAVDNCIGDLCGIICDGAKPGCAMKIVSGADSSMRAAFMALGGYGLSSDEGVLGHSPEESIANLRRVSLEGMLGVDPTVVQILEAKATRSGRA